MRSINEKSYPFDKCLDDNEGKYGKEGAKRVCGSIRAAFGEGLDEVELPAGTAQKINTEVQNAASMAQAILAYYEQIQDKEQVNFEKNQKFSIILAKLKELAAASKEEPIEENMVGKVIDGLKAIANSMNFTGNAKQTIDSLEDMGEEEAGEYLSKLFTQRAVSPRKYGRGIDLDEGLPKGYFKKEFGIGKKKKLKEATGPATIEDTQKAARKVVAAIKLEQPEDEVKISTGLDEGSFDIDLNNQAYDGGSYTVDSDGDITLVSIRRPGFVGNLNDAPSTIQATMNDVLHDDSSSIRYE